MMKYTISAISDEVAADPRRQIQLLQKCNIKKADIRSLHHKNILELTDEELMAYRDILFQNGILVSSIASLIGKTPLSCSFDNTLSELSRAFAVSDVLECSYIRIFSFFGDDSRESFKRSLERMEIMVKLAESRGKVLILENEHDTVLDNPALAHACFRSIDSANLRAVFDIANYVRSGYDALTAYALLFPYTEFFHVKDATTTGTFVPVGYGVGHAPEIIKKAVSDGFAGTFCLEPHLKYYLGSDHNGIPLDNREKIESTFSTEQQFLLSFEAFHQVLLSEV